MDKVSKVRREGTRGGTQEWTQGGTRGARDKGKIQKRASPSYNIIHNMCFAMMIEGLMETSINFEPVAVINQFDQIQSSASVTCGYQHTFACILSNLVSEANIIEL